MARDFPTGCRSKSSRTPQLDLVHRLVKPCSYGNHGRPGAQGAFRAWHLRGEIPASAMGPSCYLGERGPRKRELLSNLFERTWQPSCCPCCVAGLAAFLTAS